MRIFKHHPRVPRPKQNRAVRMKLKWSQVIAAFRENGFTDEDYGLMGYPKETPINQTIGVEEYAIGDKLKDALEAIGIEIEIDIDLKGEDRE